VHGRDIRHTAVDEAVVEVTSGKGKKPAST
jgi:hypothetical protein